MITSEMVKHIKDTLNDLTRGKNPNFGKNETATEAPKTGILIVLTNNQNVEALGDNNKVLASSTVLGKDDEIFKIDDINSKAINVINIPYSETISIEAGSAQGFAIVKVTSESLRKEQIVGSDASVTSYYKYVIDKEKLSSCPVLFSGSISDNQTIELNNSFSLSNIKITFN